MDSVIDPTSRQGPSPAQVAADMATHSERVAGAYRTSSDVPPEVRHTIRGDAREIVEELRHSGDLIKQLTLRDIRIRYKQAVFGFAWAILIPAAVVLAGMAVRVAVAYAAGRHIEMTQLAGMAVKAVPWAFFVGCLSTGTSSLVSNTSLVTKIYFPREVLPLSRRARADLRLPDRRDAHHVRAPVLRGAPLDRSCSGCPSCCCSSGRSRSPRRSSSAARTCSSAT